MWNKTNNEWRWREQQKHIYIHSHFLASQQHGLSCPDGELPGAGDEHVIYSDDVVTIDGQKEMETAAASEDEMIRMMMMMELMMLQEHRRGTQYTQMYLFICLLTW